MMKQLDPGHIMQTATAFWASKVLLTAVEFDLFSTLGDSSMTALELGETLGLHQRGIYDFLDALVAMKFLERDGDGQEGGYKNTPETATFLDKSRATYIGGFPEMLNSRLYDAWSDLGNSLKTGLKYNETKDNSKGWFEELYAEQVKLGEFLEAMSALQAGNFALLAEKFDFSKYNTVTDIGGALAMSSRTIGRCHQHLTFTSFDLPQVEPHAQKHIDAAGMTDRITAVSGDFLKEQFPKADVVMMGNILHDWNLEIKKILIKKAYDALPEGGVFIVIENIIDDPRRENVFGLLMSLNMLVELGDAFDYTGKDFSQWCTEAGFTRFEFISLAGPTSAAIAYK